MAVLTYFVLPIFAFIFRQVKCQNTNAVYYVTVENRCSALGNLTYVHLLANHTEVLGVGNLTAATTGYWDQSGNLEWHFDAALQINETRQFAVGFSPYLQSTWTLWWDSIYMSTGPTVQTLVEGTCLLENASSTTIDCYIDASCVNGLSSSLQVRGETIEYPLITVDPPSTWQCPYENTYANIGDINKTMTITSPFLSATQACISNCSLYQTEEACCLGDITAQECEIYGAAMKQGAPEAFSFAKDDEIPWQNKSMQPVKWVSGSSSSNIITIVTCF